HSRMSSIRPSLIATPQHSVAPADDSELARIDQGWLDAMAVVELASQHRGENLYQHLCGGLLQTCEADQASIATLTPNFEIREVLAECGRSEASTESLVSTLPQSLEPLTEYQPIVGYKKPFAYRPSIGSPLSLLIGHWVIHPETTAPEAVLFLGYESDYPSLDPNRLETLLPLIGILLSNEIARENERIQRLKAEALMQKTERLQSVGRLTTGIAHDFNNLLTVIQGHTQLAELYQNENDTEKATECLNQITEAGERAVDLIRQLLLFSRDTPLEEEVCDANDVAISFVSMMRRIVEENIEIETDFHPGLPPVSIDKSMVGQVIMNLIVNARDAMPEGGKIKVKSSVRNVPEDTEELTAGDYVSIVIEDSGSGMAPEVMAQIFDPFFTTKPEGKGNGIGLANAREIINQQGGQLTVESDPGSGTRFEILLPTTVERPEGLTKSTLESRGKASLDGTTVLLVEDESSVRRLVRKLLEMLGCTVVEAASGREALDIWPKVSDNIGLVVSDIVMPEGVSGWELAKELHELKPQMGILLTSGYLMRPEEHDLADDPKVAFLQKPYESKNLKSTLNQLLEHQERQEREAS
ncbi:MAG: ATP-binding protein, partial [Verrucomicrobiota bacterium]